MPHQKIIIDGKQAPSVTTVLSILRHIDLKTKRAYLELWRGKYGNKLCNWKMRVSGNIGIQYHEGVNRMANGAPAVASTSRLNAMWDRTRTWLNSVGFKPEVLEYQVRSREHFFGGTFDGVGIFSSCPELVRIGYKMPELVLADWKSSASIDAYMKLQVVLYQIGYTEQTGLPVNWGLIMRQDKKKPAPLPQVVAFPITEELRARALSIVEMFHWLWKEQNAQRSNEISILRLVNRPGLARE